MQGGSLFSNGSIYCCQIGQTDGRCEYLCRFEMALQVWKAATSDGSENMSATRTPADLTSLKNTCASARLNMLCTDSDDTSVGIIISGSIWEPPEPLFLMGNLSVPILILYTSKGSTDVRASSVKEGPTSESRSINPHTHSCYTGQEADTGDVLALHSGIAA